MKVRVRETTFLDKSINIKVGDIFEVAKEDNLSYVILFEKGFEDCKIGNNKYWRLLISKTDIMEDYIYNKMFGKLK